ncbi:MAG: glycoside hydrolase family 88 protein [Lachnospiraceae bacterium]|nr:glycoside hydrolase family 88 protein [Lachnospiraceae bacterium]
MYQYKERTPIGYAKMACDTLMRKFQAEELPPKGHFHYHQGVFLSGMEKTYQVCGEEKYADYIKAWVDSLIDEEGQLHGFQPEELDDIQPGILLYRLFETTGDERYRKVLDELIGILKAFPKNRLGGYWHKEKNKEQMWLDGLYMAGPILALYGKYFGDTECLDICRFQALLMEEKTKDEKTGLLYHAWDSLGTAKWADPETGRSPEFWGRSIGWVPVAILDELECMPEDYEGYDELKRMAVELLKAVLNYQEKNGLWYQVVDKMGQEGNWLETSCSCLFAAAISKAVRLGFMERSYLDKAKLAFEGVADTLRFEDGNLIISGICVGTGVGDYEHYCRRPTSENDLHGTGAFLLMCAELEMALADA